MRVPLRILGPKEDACVGLGQDDREHSLHNQKTRANVKGDKISCSYQYNFAAKCSLTVRGTDLRHSLRMRYSYVATTKHEHRTARGRTYIGQIIRKGNSFRFDDICTMYMVRRRARDDGAETVPPRDKATLLLTCRVRRPLRCRALEPYDTRPINNRESVRSSSDPT